MLAASKRHQKHTSASCLTFLKRPKPLDELSVRPQCADRSTCPGISVYFLVYFSNARLQASAAGALSMPFCCLAPISALFFGLYSACPGV